MTEKNGALDGPSFDPDDWEDFRRSAHTMLDLMIDHLRDVREHGVWRPVPPHVQDHFQGSIPERGVGSEKVFEEFARWVLPYPTGTAHPRFWGWAVGSGSPMGMMASLLGAGMNSIPGYFDDAAAIVEGQLMTWMIDQMGFPAASSGTVTSGASVANLIGLLVARDSCAGYDVNRFGVDPGQGSLTLYCSSEAHVSIDKAARLLGIGESAVKRIPTDKRFKVDAESLDAAIRSDRASGCIPFAVVGTAGTINTGAVDDLNRLADIASEHRLWLHVDGAFGALARLSPETRARVSGLSRADSLAFDFHKWMHVNYEAGCVLVRNRAALKKSLAAGGSYLEPQTRGVAANPDAVSARGLQLSRGFKALKPWMLIKEQGIATIGEAIARNVRQATYLADRLARLPKLVLSAPVELNVVAFRYVNGGWSSDQEDALNRELLYRLQESRGMVPSSCAIEGRFTLRVSICNHRTTKSDLDLFLDALKDLVPELERQHA